MSGNVVLVLLLKLKSEAKGKSGEKTKKIHGQPIHCSSDIVLKKGLATNSLAPIALLSPV